MGDFYGKYFEEKPPCHQRQGVRCMDALLSGLFRRGEATFIASIISRCTGVIGHENKDHADNLLKKLEDDKWTFRMMANALR